MFAPPAPPPAAAAEAPLVWLAQPTPDEIDRAEAFVSDPLRAPLGAPAGGHGSMICFVHADGGLEGCRADSRPGDTPGFVDATLRLQRFYRLDPRTRPDDGVVLVKVTFPRRFDEAPRVLSHPKPEEIAAAGPPGLVGSVSVLCTLTAQAALEACAAQAGDSREPHDPRLDAAALSLSGKFRVRAARLKGAPVTAYEVVNVGFTGGHRVVNPEWAERPDARALMDAFPRLALEAGRSGEARIRCEVKATGLLTGCQVVAESPEGFGFGSAALMLSSRFAMKPCTVDGRPVEEGDVVIPIKWETSGPQVTDPGSAMRIYAWAPWLQAPDAVAVAAAYPKAAAARGVTGRATLRCKLSKDGRPYGCDTMAETPEGRGFADAAMKLSKDFRSNMVGVTPAQLTELRITLNFDFSPRTLAPPGDRYVRSIDWIRGPSVDAVRQAYPPEALKAGERTGLGNVECRIGADGALDGCLPAPGKADPLGFGAAAAKVAAGMQANLWTQDGEAAVGQKISAPIRMIYGPDAPAGAKPAS